MRKTIPTLLLAMAAVSMLGGCHAIYRPDVQQGNLLIGKNVSELKPGLTKQQVLALLGTPSVISPFDQNQWNYVATLQRRGGTVKERTLTLHFDNDTLVRTEGDFMKETPQELLRESHKYGPLYPSNLTKEQQKDLEKKQKQGG
ncbi:MAG: outer membrane protein assembly factor BamE [Rhodanobacteraceae bacterium]